METASEELSTMTSTSASSNNLNERCRKRNRGQSTADSESPSRSCPEHPNPVKLSKMVDAANDGDLQGIQCRLESLELWHKFHQLGTEMIITKTGRRMFPTIKCRFTNFNESLKDSMFAILLDIMPCDQKRYRYAYHRSSWLVAGKSDPEGEHRYFVHQDGPFKAFQLNSPKSPPISFDKVKLTNNEKDTTGQMKLNSMHKYQPRIHLVQLKDDRPPPLQGCQAAHLLKDAKAVKVFAFPETVFMAVTAYQNQLITKLKIDSNPFAKGFRDSPRLSEIERAAVTCTVGVKGPKPRIETPASTWTASVEDQKAPKVTTDPDGQDQNCIGLQSLQASFVQRCRMLQLLFHQRQQQLVTKGLIPEGSKPAERLASDLQFQQTIQFLHRFAVLQCILQATTGQSSGSVSEENAAVTMRPPGEGSEQTRSSLH